MVWLFKNASKQSNHPPPSTSFLLHLSSIYTWIWCYIMLHWMAWLFLTSNGKLREMKIKVLDNIMHMYILFLAINDTYFYSSLRRRYNKYESAFRVLSIDFSLLMFTVAEITHFVQDIYFWLLKIGVLKLATYQSIIVCRSRVIRVSIHSRLLCRWSSKLRKKCGGGEKRAGQPFSRTGQHAEQQQQQQIYCASSSQQTLPSPPPRSPNHKIEDFFVQWPKNSTSPTVSLSTKLVGIIWQKFFYFI